eukprot:jgi/Botrbrau1/3851/Bobra.0183s0076.1
MGAVAAAVTTLCQNGGSLWANLAPLLLFWVLGTVMGWLLPRPKVFPVWPFGVTARRVPIAFHGLYIARQLWMESLARPQSVHRALLSIGLAVYGLLLGRGWYQKRLVPSNATISRPEAQSSVGRAVRSKTDDVDWYITDADLQFFKDRIERDAAPSGAKPWDHMMDKRGPGFSYSAWRSFVAGNKTDYKSITVCHNATAEEFMDFFLDDPARMKWDNMISHHETLEDGDIKHRCQVVRWVRSFPFSFLSDREYIIGRRVWRAEDGCLYGITKSIVHPRAVDNSRIVRMDVFYSMWRNRTIPCPEGSGRPACETILLHREDFKISESLARFAVRHGMGGFVKSLTNGARKFIDERRTRADMFEEDPEAFGRNAVPNPPLQRSASEFSLADGLGDDAESPPSSDSDTEETPSQRSVARPSRRQQQRAAPSAPRRFRSMVAAGVAVGFAYAVGRSTNPRVRAAKQQ